MSDDELFAGHWQCRKPIVLGSPYCEHHAALAMRDREKDANEDAA